MAATDYYEILGVSKTATEDEIKRAYRRLARQYHPDANGGSHEAEERFKEISIAYETLIDPEKRRRYDMFGPDNGRGYTNFDVSDFFSGSFSDIFSSFFRNDFSGGYSSRTRRRIRGQDISTSLRLTFREAVFGTVKELKVKKPVVCDVCGGSGVQEGTKEQTCPDCKGRGQISNVRSTFLGQMVTTSYCPRCSGTGVYRPHPCRACSGSGLKAGTVSYQVEVPAGVAEGTTLKLRSKGGEVPKAGEPGDLYIEIEVEPDPEFEREGDDLICRLDIPYPLAVLGGSIKIDTLDGQEEINIAKGTTPGTVIKIPKKGVPKLNSKSRGDLLVVISIFVPTSISREEQELLEKLNRLYGSYDRKVKFENKQKHHRLRFF